MLAQLKAPAKTFLVGEYLVLEGGPGWILTTDPQFELHISRGRGLLSGIHPQSPAGRLWAERIQALTSLDARFADPYEGRGGFGASGAQFLTVWTLVHSLSEGSEIRLPRESEISQLLRDYRHFSIAPDGKGHAPSGADLVAQLQGGITEWSERDGQLRRWQWSFSDISFLLVRTGEKVATHEHLSRRLEIPVRELHEAVDIVKASFENSDSRLLVDGLREYRQHLMGQGWVHPCTVNLVDTLEKLEGVRMAKGCGALGADIVLVVVDKPQKPLVESQIQSMNLEICGSEKSLCERGLALSERKG